MEGSEADAEAAADAIDVEAQRVGEDAAVAVLEVEHEARPERPREAAARLSIALVSLPLRSDPRTTPYCARDPVMSVPLTANVTFFVTLAAPPTGYRAPKGP